MASRPKPTSRKRPRTLFDRIGNRGWRGSGHFTFTVVSGALRRWIVGRLPKKPRTILSLGCGSGELERRIAEAGHRVVGVDVSLPILRSARRRGMTAAVMGDAMQLPFRDASFDYVLLAETIGYVDLPVAFAEASRVLKKRGRLLITTYAPPVEAHIRYRKYRHDEIVGPLADAGFRVAESSFLRVNRSKASVAARSEDAAVLFLEGRKRAARPISG